MRFAVWEGRVSLGGRDEALTQAVRAALALAQNGHPAVGGRTALREALNGPVAAGAAGAGVGLPRVSHQQHVSIVSYAVLLLAAVHRQQGALGFICGHPWVQTCYRGGRAEGTGHTYVIIKAGKTTMLVK